MEQRPTGRGIPSPPGSSLPISVWGVQPGCRGRARRPACTRERRPDRRGTTGLGPVPGTQDGHRTVSLNIEEPEVKELGVDQGRDRTSPCRWDAGLLGAVAEEKEWRSA